MTSTQEIVEHRDAMLDVFTEVTQDCLLLGLTPCHVSINRWSNGSLNASVQFLGRDTKAVDALADSYGLPPAGWEGGNYTRLGRLDIDGRRVEVSIYSGRPLAPSFPADYSPQAVEA